MKTGYWDRESEPARNGKEERGILGIYCDYRGTFNIQAAGHGLEIGRSSAVQSAVLAQRLHKEKVHWIVIPCILRSAGYAVFKTHIVVR